MKKTSSSSDATRRAAYTLKLGDELLLDGVLVRMRGFAPRGRRAVVLEVDGDVPVRRVKKDDIHGDR